MFARMSRKSAVLFPCLTATFSSANKPTCKYLWEEALEEPTSLASPILNVDSNFESTHGMKITIMNYTDTSSIHGTVFEVIFYKRGRAFYQSLKHKREPIDLDFCRPSYKSNGDKNVANFAAEVEICVKKKKILKYYWLCYLELTARLKTTHSRKFHKIELSISSRFLPFNFAAATCHKNRLNYQSIEE